MNGKKIGTCLGDLFSVNWMEDTDSFESLANNYSLQEQFEVVAVETNMSSVMQWGDLNFTSEATADYLSGTTTVTPSLLNFISRSRRRLREDVFQPSKSLNISSR